MKTILMKIGFMPILILLACVPAEFKNPLSSPDKAISDISLNGLWASNDKITDYIFIKNKNNGMADLVWIDNQEEGKGVNTIQCEIYPTEIEKSKYLNLKVVTKNDSGELKYSNNYMILKYEVKNKLLSIWFLDETYCTDAIKNGSLEGKIDGKQSNEHIVVTDTQDKNISFIKNNKSDDIFNSFGEFHKIE